MEPRFAVLATMSQDGPPQQTVMWYELRGDMIMMNTAEGRIKSGNLRRDPRISLCIEDGYRYLTITGRAALETEQGPAQADIAALALRYHDEAKAREMISEFRAQHRISIYMSIDTVVPHGFS
jgi:PPOX class probable F420-dependent enzyme